MLYIACDHAGVNDKNIIKKILDSLNVEYIDMGTNSKESVDYPVYAKKVCKKILEDKKKKIESKGILICGTGTGMSIAANRFKGIRACLAYDDYSSKMSRYDNDSNVLALRARHFAPKKYDHIIKLWLKTKFANKVRHKRRIKQLDR